MSCKQSVSSVAASVARRMGLQDLMGAEKEKNRLNQIHKHQEVDQKERKEIAGEFMHSFIRSFTDRDR
jgi:hypothetical protein